MVLKYKQPKENRNFIKVLVYNKMSNKMNNYLNTNVKNAIIIKQMIKVTIINIMQIVNKSKKRNNK